MQAHASTAVQYDSSIFWVKIHACADEFSRINCTSALERIHVSLLDNQEPHEGNINATGSAFRLASSVTFPGPPRQ